jgi:hypothetical protein
MHRHLILPIALIAIAFAACKQDEPPKSMDDIDVASPTYNVINLLTASGNSVDLIGGAPHPYFDAKNVLIRVNGGVDLELYEFKSMENLEDAAMRVAPDASKIDGKDITWSSPPHFFKTDKVIILYSGADASNAAQLSSVFGQQFAGK